LADSYGDKFLSAIILTKNSSRTLKQAMDGLLKSSLRPDEVIVVDGGSTDSTPQIIDSYKDKFRIKVIYDRGMGYGYARDIGWRNSTGKYVAMVDSDVVVAPDFFKKATNILENDQGCAAIAGKLLPETEERGLLADFQTKNLAITLFKMERSYPATTLSIHTACTVYRKSSIDSVGGFSHKFMLAKEDSDMAFKLKKKGYRLSLIDVYCRHLETGKRFFRTNFKYGRSYPVISSEHPDMAPLWTPKSILYTASVFLIPLQVPIFARYFRRYLRETGMAPLEALEMAGVETLRQFLRYSGMVHQLIKGGYT
jgi:glycosyltransferase involved in cell wall biosynthesis